MQSPQVEKAKIVNLDTKEEVECHFNPTQYSFDKKNEWKNDQKTGKNTPQITFGGGSPATLTMELLFDTYSEAKPPAKPEDVRKKYTDKLWKLMMVEPKTKVKKTDKGRPPRVKFLWGKSKIWSFEGVILSLSQKFTLFLENGVPVRATVNVTFQQSKDEASLAPQNPTSGGLGGERLWTVTQGDTLGWIAYKEFGDTSRWRLIAEANHLRTVRRLTPGMVLVIPNG